MTVCHEQDSERLPWRSSSFQLGLPPKPPSNRMPPADNQLYKHKELDSRYNCSNKGLHIYIYLLFDRDLLNKTKPKMRNENFNSRIW